MGIDPVLAANLADHASLMLLGILAVIGVALWTNYGSTGSTTFLVNLPPEAPANETDAVETGVAADDELHAIYDSQEALDTDTFYGLSD